MINAGTTKTLYDAHVAGALGPGQPALGAGAGAADVITFVEDFFNTDPNWNNVPTPAPGSLPTRIEKGVAVSYGELANNAQLGSERCRERVCRYVENAVVA